MQLTIECKEAKLQAIRYWNSWVYTHYY